MQVPLLSNQTIIVLFFGETIFPPIYDFSPFVKGRWTAQISHQIKNPKRKVMPSYLCLEFTILSCHFSNTIRVLDILRAVNQHLKGFEICVQKLWWNEITKRHQILLSLLFSFIIFIPAHVFNNRIHKTYFLMSLLWEFLQHYLLVHDSKFWCSNNFSAVVLSTVKSSENTRTVFFKMFYFWALAKSGMK